MSVLVFLEYISIYFHRAFATHVQFFFIVWTYMYITDNKILHLYPQIT